MKFFWRLKRDEANESIAETVTATAKGPEAAQVAARNQAAAVAADEEPAIEVALGASVEAAEQEGSGSNVITLQPARLSERIAAAAMKTVTSLTASEPFALVTDTLKPRAPGALPGQEAAYQHLARALASNSRAHILVTGRTGSGRRTAVLENLERQRAVLERPCDWIYVASGDGRTLEPFSLPHGQGAFFVREANAAITRARQTYERLVAGDDFRLGLEIIDEEYRQRAGKTVDLMKRRAEEQNIALVKTAEGFVLAPMHDGKVVRNDVFRALPDSMQREVEAKIAELEDELKGFLERLPQEDSAQAERIAAFHREGALRAVKPHMDALRTGFSDCKGVLDALQILLVSGIAGDGLGHSADHRAAFRAQVFGAQLAADFAEKSPLVFAHEASPQGLCGEVGRDGTGGLVLKPGALMRANGGYLVVEAWRLAADPRAWAALAAAFETGEVQPVADGSSTAGAVPFAARVVLIADEHSLTRLLAIDAGLKRYFSHIVRFPSSLPRSAMGIAEYASFAATIAAAEGLRPIATNAADALYRAALRDGDAATVQLDTHTLRALLRNADLEAAAEDAAQIRAAHIEEAARNASELII